MYAYVPDRCEYSGVSEGDAAHIPLPVSPTKGYAILGRQKELVAGKGFMPRKDNPPPQVLFMAMRRL